MYFYNLISVNMFNIYAVLKLLGGREKMSPTDWVVNGPYSIL